MGAWTVDEEGNFTLDEYYQECLDEAHAEGREAYMRAITKFVTDRAREGADSIAMSEVLREASDAWQEAVFDYIGEVGEKQYRYDFLHEELLRRVAYDNVTPEGVLDGMIIDALEGVL